MSAVINYVGNWRTAGTMYVKVGGVWKIVDEASTRVAGIWKVYHKNVIEALLTSTTNAVMQDLFTPAEWASTTPKLVTIPSGQVIGSNDNTIEALRTGTGGGGLITLNVIGEIQGAGGNANSGVGGDALRAEQSIDLINIGAIRAGGGGGGQGGAGGTGLERIYEGPYWQWNIYATGSWDGAYHWLWAGSHISGVNATSITVDGWTYTRESSSSHSSWASVRYGLRRTRSFFRDGGSGGAGARGLGFDGAQGNGVGGAAGGTNAGTGGTGGASGSWGDAGSSGAVGANGNYLNGNVGVAGGLSGHALRTIANINLTNIGIIQGIQA